MYRKILTDSEAFLSSRKNFAALINAACFNGKRHIRSEELELISCKLLEENAVRQMFPHYVRCVAMHSREGDIKLIQLGGKH